MSLNFDNNQSNNDALERYLVIHLVMKKEGLTVINAKIIGLNSPLFRYINQRIAELKLSKSSKVRFPAAIL